MGLERPSLLSEPRYTKDIIYGDTTQPLQDIYEESLTQKYAIGTPLIYGCDGRKFRYDKNGGVALSKAYMTQSVVLDAKLVDEIQTGKTQSVGEYEITILITTGITLAEDDLQDAIMVVNKATGIGDVYKILASKVGTTDTQLTLLLDTPIRTALDANSEITIVKNRWRDVVVYPTTATGRAAGVPLINVTISYFFWAQTGGLAPIYVDTGDTIQLGNLVGKPGTHAVPGACGVPTAGTSEVWGRCAYNGVEAEVALIDLDLD